MYTQSCCLKRNPLNYINIFKKYQNLSIFGLLLAFLLPLWVLPLLMSYILGAIRVLNQLSLCCTLNAMNVGILGQNHYGRDTVKNSATRPCVIFVASCFYTFCASFSPLASFLEELMRFVWKCPKSRLKLKIPIQTLINPKIKNWISRQRIKLF